MEHSLVSGTRKWKIFCGIALLSGAMLASFGIDTFDAPENFVWLTVGVPFSLGLFNFLNYLEWKRLKGKVSRANIRRSHAAASALGLVASVAFLCLPEVVNALTFPASTLDEAILVEKRISSLGKYRNRYATFLSKKGSGKFEIEISPREYRILDTGDLYRIRYRKGWLGWKFKVGGLEAERIADLKNRYGDECD